MATRDNVPAAPAPTGSGSPGAQSGNYAAEQWEAPESDQEFVFESVDKAPSWIDKNWASFDRGPALALPAGDVFGSPPYTTKIARVGDKVVFSAATGSMPARFDVIPGDPIEVGPSRKPPQQSPVALEDALKTGWLTPEDIGPDGRAQVAARSPALKRLVEENKNAPEAQPVSDVVKVD